MNAINNKILLALKILIIIILLGCLFDMPYGYYQLTRFLSMCVFIVLAISYYKNNKNPWLYFYASSALLFNPFFKIHLGRDLWNIIDVIVAIIIIVNIVLDFSKNK